MITRAKVEEKIVMYIYHMIYVAVGYAVAIKISPWWVPVWILGVFTIEQLIIHVFKNRDGSNTKKLMDTIEKFEKENK